MPLGLPFGPRSQIQREGFLEDEGSHSFDQYGLYEYPQIGPNQVRLLILLGGRPQDPIHGLLEVVDFAALRVGRYRYDALSYAWGKEEPIHPILVEDISPPVCQGAKKFFIRTNLYRALRRLREEPGLTIGLWIDAICIDQASPEEKTDQLPKMMHIYNGAANTCIWIGESNTGGISTERGMLFVEDIVDISLLDGLLTSRDHIQDWVAFAELLSKDWFSRRWIIQEVASSRFATIRFGGIEMKWADFVDAIEIFHRSLERAPDNLLRGPYLMGDLGRVSTKILTCESNGRDHYQCLPPLGKSPSPKSLVSGKVGHETQQVPCVGSERHHLCIPGNCRRQLPGRRNESRAGGTNSQWRLQQTPVGGLYRLCQIYSLKNSVIGYHLSTMGLSSITLVPWP